MLERILELAAITFAAVATALGMWAIYLTLSGAYNWLYATGGF